MAEKKQIKRYRLCDGRSVWPQGDLSWKLRWLPIEEAVEGRIFHDNGIDYRIRLFRGDRILDESELLDLQLKELQETGVTA